MNHQHYKIIKKSNSIYNRAADAYGISNKAVLWNDQQSQYFRFSELIKPIDLSGNKTILDIGCGNCELYKFLNFMGFRGRYTGFDINKKLIGQAKKRFKGIDARVFDIVKDTTRERFDYVLMSGLFNVNAGQSVEWVQLFLKKMYRLCREIMVFNMISTYVNYRDESMFYLNPSEMLSFCIEQLSRRVIISHHSLPYNFTVAVFRDDAWVSINE